VSYFWDTSAVIPLLVQEPASERLLALLRDDEHMVVWWGTRVECVSALAPRGREGGFDATTEMQDRTVLNVFANAWSEIQPTDRVRSLAERLLAVHPLRAADALQLASALVWSEGVTDQRSIVCLDDRLRDAATKEGFTVQPLHP
jgi:predicted nucleic acid-binding protein